MEMIIELPLLALVEAHLAAANGLAFAGGGIIADVDITINAPVTWSESGVLTIADGVTVTTNGDFTVGTAAILDLGDFAADD